MDRVPVQRPYKAMRKYYVVFIGRKPGIYDKWSDANAEVSGHRGACFQGYNTRREAEEAFNSYFDIKSDFPSSSKPTTSTTSSSVTGNTERKTRKNLGHLIEAVSDLTRKNRKLAKTMEKNAEKISMLLAQMEMLEE